MNTAKMAKVNVCAFYLIFNFLLAGCIDFQPAVKSVVEILDEAIVRMESQSISWQGVLEDTRDELIENGHTLVSNDVSNMLSRAISDIGVEARCYTDFLRDRVKEDLIRLRASFTGEQLSLLPVFCVASPRFIDFALVQEGQLKAIEIDGYNLDVAEIKVYLVDNQDKRVDVTSELGSPTRYLITLPLGSNGVPLSSQSNKILFELGSDQEQSVNIIQPIPQPEVYSFTPPPFLNLCPDKIGGDKEFDGHGPNVSVSAVLFTKDERELWVQISLHAKETRSDWSEAKGKWEYSLWQAPIGSTITEFAPNLPSIAKYKDDNDQLDIPTIEGSGLVQRFEIMGDTDGDDIGNCTDDDMYMNIVFNEIQVEYVGQ